MSERELVDEGGRTWRYIGRGTSKTWNTWIDGHEYRMESRPAQGGWSLARPTSVNVPMNENQIARAITVAQVYLPDYQGPPTAATTEQVRDAATGDALHVSTGMFDAWLTQHDKELIEAVTSAASAMQYTTKEN